MSFVGFIICTKNRNKRINKLLKSPSSVGRYKSTRIDEGKKCRILFAIKISAGTVVGRGEGSPLYDPGSKLYYWEGEINASITINMMGKIKKSEVCITAAVTIRYRSKLHRPTRSGLTVVVLCKWSIYNFSYHTQQT